MLIRPQEVAVEVALVFASSLKSSFSPYSLFLWVAMMKKADISQHVSILNIF